MKIDGTRSNDRASELVLDYYAALNRNDIDGVLALLSEDVVHEINQGPREVGHAAFAAFHALRPGLKPHIVVCAPGGYRHPRHKVIDLGLVSHSRQQPNGHGFGPRFIRDLRHPLTTSAIAHSILLRVATFLFLDERDATQIGTHRCAAWSEKKVAPRNVIRTLPQDRRSRQSFFLFLLSRETSFDRSDT